MQKKRTKVKLTAHLNLHMQICITDKFKSLLSTETSEEQSKG